MHSATAATRTASNLRCRARRLRHRSRPANPLLAEAYRRRAAEIELQAWATELRYGPRTVDPVDTTDQTAA